VGSAGIIQNRFKGDIVYFVHPPKGAAQDFLSSAAKTMTKDVVKILDEKYEIVSEIKRGGFGVIYYGRDRVFDKPVAIKAISPDLLGEAKYFDIFQAESLSVARLNHQNIVRLYDIKRTEDGQFYIIMEYIDGVDLGKLLITSRKGALELPYHLSAYVIAQVCAGLDYAHARRDADTHQPLNIVHQDISPSNVMISRKGEVKIIDFGMANARRRLAPQRGRKREVLVQGKIAYLAPEQVNGRTSLDRRSDLFSLGLVLYEILTGERFIKGEKPAEVIAILESGNWDFSKMITKRVPEPLQLVVQRAVQKDPEKRYPSANQMYLDLMNYLAIQAAGADFSHELSQLVRRLVPAAEREGVRAEPSSESVQNQHRTATPDNGMHTASLREKSPSIEFVASTPSQKKDSSMEIEIPNQSNDKATDNLSATSDDNYFVEAKPQPSSTSLPAEVRDHSGEGAIHSDSPVQDVPYFRILEDDEEEDEQRTIIDVIRLSARSHKKEILLTLVGLAAACALFTIGDTALRWTAYGSAIYDLLFPPAIRLVSFPPNAQVYLDDEPLAQATPLAIEKISPGVHKLMLLLPRFDPIIRSIQVPPKGKAVVQGEAESGENQTYIFRFKITLQLSSKPSGAQVYLNGIKYTQSTPCRVVWEVGDPLQIEMEKPGLARLAGFTLNTLEGVENIEDRRVWRFQRIEQDREHFAIEGTFAKAIALTSTPNNAEIYLDGSERPVGVTGYTNRLLLTIGMHTVTLQKRGYKSKTFTIQVDENTPDQYHEVLARVVKILAREVSEAGEKDISARVIKLTYENTAMNVRATTPCELTLLPYTYTVLLRKEGYKDYTLRIPPAAQVAVARMERMQVPVEIILLDEATGTPLDGVQISYRSLSTPDSQEILLDQTDETGVTIKDLPPGEYRFIARKAGYRDAIKDFLTKTNGKNRLVFMMTAM
jgi:serine/threonine protein kinase